MNEGVWDPGLEGASLTDSVRADLEHRRKKSPFASHAETPVTPDLSTTPRCTLLHPLYPDTGVRLVITCVVVKHNKTAWARLLKKPFQGPAVPRPPATPANPIG